MVGLHQRMAEYDDLTAADLLEAAVRDLVAGYDQMITGDHRVVADAAADDNLVSGDAH